MAQEVSSAIKEKLLEALKRSVAESATQPGDAELRHGIEVQPPLASQGATSAPPSEFEKLSRQVREIPGAAQQRSARAAQPGAKSTAKIGPPPSASATVHQSAPTSLASRKPRTIHSSTKIERRASVEDTLQPRTADKATTGGRPERPMRQITANVDYTHDEPPLEDDLKELSERLLQQLLDAEAVLERERAGNTTTPATGNHSPQTDFSAFYRPAEASLPNPTIGMGTAPIGMSEETEQLAEMENDALTAKVRTLLEPPTETPPRGEERQAIDPTAAMEPPVPKAPTETRPAGKPAPIEAAPTTASITRDIPAKSEFNDKLSLGEFGNDPNSPSGTVADSLPEASPPPTDPSSRVEPSQAVNQQGSTLMDNSFTGGSMADLSGYKDLSRAPLSAGEEKHEKATAVLSSATAASHHPAALSSFDRVPALTPETFSELNPEVDTEFSGNVQTLIRLVNELPDGVTKQTGAQIIRLTMEAMGISMEDVLSDAQSAQSEMLDAVRANIKKIEEYKTVIRKLETDIKYYQGKANELSEIIDLFILSNTSSKVPTVDELSHR